MNNKLKAAIYGLAVADAVGGIMYGLDGIPSDWLQVLRGKDIIEACLF